MSQATPQDTAPATKAATLRLREDLIHPDPLLDCLVELCRLHGQAATRASLSAALPLRDGRLTIELAERAAARAGMTTRLQRLALAGIDTAPSRAAPRPGSASCRRTCSGTWPSG